MTNISSSHKKNAVDALQFSAEVQKYLDDNFRLAHMFGTDDRGQDDTFGVHALLSPEDGGDWLMLSTSLTAKNPSYISLTRTTPSANWYERYMMDMFGITAAGHPDHRRLVHHENVPLNMYPLRKDFSWNTVMKKDDVPYPMHHVEGNGIFEIPVGPIHAGIIEPGHFRFNVAGERIINLEGKLFFTHKGVEKIVEGKTYGQALPFVERVSADSAASHAFTYALALEHIAGAIVPQRAQLLRVLVAELERLTMHIHDISNMGGMGTGYTVMAAQGFRIKEKLVRLSEKIFGNRFWRGYIVPGGVAKDLTESDCELIESVVDDVMDEMHELLKIGLESDGLCERLVGTGILKVEAAKAYGAVGVAARASDIKMDTRVDHPYSGYEKLHCKVVTKSGRDVHARFMVRVDELEVSAELIEEVIKLLADEKGPVRKNIEIGAGDAMAAVEGWRGEIIYYVRTDKNGEIDRMSMRDASFCNWPLFGELGPGNIVPDFPLCNKSLNLSYSGTDL